MSKRPLTRRSFLAATGQVAAAGTLLPWWAERVVAQDSRIPLPFTVDAHCHIFNVDDLPIDGFALAFAHGIGVPTFLDAALTPFSRGLHKKLVEVANDRRNATISAQDAAKAIRTALGLAQRSLTAWAGKVLGKPVPEAPQELIEAVIAALEVITRDVYRGGDSKGRPLTVPEQLKADYGSVSLFLPAIVDYKYWVDHGRSTKSEPAKNGLRNTVDLHAKALDKINRVPNAKQHMHAYMAFNPWRQIQFDAGRDAVDPMRLLQEALGVGDYEDKNRGFVGVKLYPASGFLPHGNANIGEHKGTQFGRDLDDVMENLFEFCAEHDVPVLTHASNGNGFSKDYAWRGSPWPWKWVLDQFPDLRVSFGHFGHLEGVHDDQTVLCCVAWAKHIVSRLMVTHPNVYADLSFSPLLGAKDDRERYMKYLLKELLPEGRDVLPKRLLYASDWWLYALVPDFKNSHACFQAMLHDVSAGSGMSDESSVQLQHDFMGLNALRFLGLRDADGKVVETSKTFERLNAYYNRPDIRGTRSPGWMPSFLKAGNLPQEPGTPYDVLHKSCRE